MTQPTISVLLPIYNAEEYLEQCLDSVRGQAYENLEVLCINDGSTDASKQIIERYAAQDARFRLLDKPNGGYGSALNVGLSQATGDYVAIVEPDDWIESGMYADMIAYAATFAQPVDIIKTGYWRIWMPDTSEQKKMHCSYHRRIKPHSQPFTIDDPGAVHLLCHHPSVWSAIYRRAFLDEHDIRLMEIPGAGWADNPFLVATLCQARTILYLDNEYYCYRENTPEQDAAFALNHTLLPFERWNDMADVLERLGVTDDGIWRAHNSRGFTYLQGTLEEVPLDRADVNAAAVQMFSRMDARLVMSDPEISPGCKEMFLTLLDLPPERIAKLPYIGGIIKQGFYNLGNVGVANTLGFVKNYFEKRREREGYEYVKEEEAEKKEESEGDRQ